MLNTPEQAREKWCPMVRVGVMPSAGGPAGVSDPSTEFHGNCIADKCAMWRWAPSPTWHRERQVEDRTFALVGGGTETRQVEFEVPVPDAPTQGYCGLAGRPEVA